MRASRSPVPSPYCVLSPVVKKVSQGNSRGVVDPRFLGLGIATGRLSLLEDGAAGLVQTCIDLAQLVLALDLDAEMVEPRPFAARRDREIHARVIKHPFRIVSLHHGRLRREQRRIKLDRIREVFDADMNMYALHGMYSLYRRQRLVSDALHHGFKIFPDLVRETKPFDDGSRSKQWQDANIVEGQSTVDRQRALDQSIEFIKFRC